MMPYVVRCGFCEQGSIMAHLPVLCESRRLFMHRAQGIVQQVRQGWRSRVPVPCALCAGAARGGALCAHCHGLVVSGTHAVQKRCERCRLALGAQDACPDCSAGTPAFDRIIAAFDYSSPADFLIHRLKVQRRFTDVPMLARLLADEVFREWPDMPPDLVLVSVPSGRHAIRQRGFNRAAEVARTLARLLHRPHRPELICRVREGRKQATLDREARMIATARLYQTGADVRGLRIAVIDDVLTTGSTMHSIARVLKRSGAVSVHGLVLARTPHSLP